MSDETIYSLKELHHVIFHLYLHSHCVVGSALYQYEVLHQYYVNNLSYIHITEALEIINLRECIVYREYRLLCLEVATPSIPSERPGIFANTILALLDIGTTLTYDGRIQFQLRWKKTILSRLVSIFHLYRSILLTDNTVISKSSGWKQIMFPYVYPHRLFRIVSTVQFTSIIAMLTIWAIGKNLIPYGLGRESPRINWLLLSYGNEKRNCIARTIFELVIYRFQPQPSTT